MLKEILSSKGVKQKWIAKHIGVSEVTVSNWVKNKSIPKENHLMSLARLLDMPIAELTNLYNPAKK